MKNKSIVSQAAKLTEKANALIVSELKKRGIIGIAPSHGDILVLLFGGKSLPMAQIAEAIHKTKATVSVLVDKLEAAGYARRSQSEDDARVFLVSLTEKGEALKPDFEAISKFLHEKAFANFSDFELDALEKLLKRAVSNLN
jgi:DNA-binding MarR family transcriptional regulator